MAASDIIEAGGSAEGARYEGVVDGAAADVLCLRLLGRWGLPNRPPAVAEVGKELDRPGIKRLAFDSAGLTGWDSGLLTFLTNLDRLSTTRDIATDPAGLPDGVRRLLRLALP